MWYEGGRSSWSPGRAVGGVSECGLGRELVWAASKTVRRRSRITFVQSITSKVNSMRRAEVLRMEAKGSFSVEVDEEACEEPPRRLENILGRSGTTSDQN